jgi:alkylation response protein AidB-like acyl-CoA dehydrogenase
MRLEFSDEQRQFQRSLRELLSKEYSVRKAWAGEAQSIWHQLAELGVLGIAVPESAGGLGGSALDWILLAEEAGRAALAAPLAEAFAAPPLLPPEWQSMLAQGRANIALASDHTLVPEADLYLVHREGRLHLVPRTSAHLKRVSVSDGARRVHRIEFSTSTRSDGDWGAAFDRMALASAAELVGLGQHLLDVAVEYVKLRQQFGQPVGSFQAVKHVLANALLELEFARPFVYRAAYQPTPLHISMAKAAASDAAHHAARAALQCHGAIGYSFEHDLHMWMKRVWSLEPAWGSALWHRERVARQILDGQVDGETHEPSLHR